MSVFCGVGLVLWRVDGPVVLRVGCTVNTFDSSADIIVKHACSTFTSHPLWLVAQGVRAGLLVGPTPGDEVVLALDVGRLKPKLLKKLKRRCEVSTHRWRGPLHRCGCGSKPAGASINMFDDVHTHRVSATACCSK
jgi:hypothetical protein